MPISPIELGLDGITIGGIPEKMIFSAVSEDERAIFASLPLITTSINTNSEYTFKISPSMESASSLGYKRDEWLVNPYWFWLTHLHKEDSEKVLAEYNYIPKPNENRVIEYRMIAKDGKPRWIRESTQLTESQVLQTTLQDVTEEVYAKQSLENFKKRFESSATPQWIEDFSRVKEAIGRIQAEAPSQDLRSYLETNPAKLLELANLVRIIDVNNAMLAMHKTHSKSEVLSRRLDYFLTEDSADVFLEQVLAVAEGKKSYKSGKPIQAASNGDKIYVTVEWKVLPGYEDSYGQLIVSVNDVTKLEQDASIDPLTGLLNPLKFESELRKEIERAVRNSKPFSLLVVDLDKLSTINDFAKFGDDASDYNQGHAAGNEALKQLSTIARIHIRNYDIAARLTKGDEFAFGLIDSSISDALREAYTIKEEIAALTPFTSRKSGMNKFNEFIKVGQKLPINISGGLAELSEVRDTQRERKLIDARNRNIKIEDNFTLLIEHYMQKLQALADRRLYHAKDTGKNIIVSSDDKKR